MTDEKNRGELAIEDLDRVDPENVRSVVPSGELGIRGRELPVEERARIFDELFFEEERRTPYLWRFFSLMVFSSTIAALGLVNDSAAVVIGAMLIAPLMTPLLGLSAAIVQAWTKRQLHSLGIVIGGALVGIAIGWLVMEALPTDDDVLLPGEVLARTNPNLLDLGIAVAAGAAGAYVMIRKEAGSALPGVGIAVALVPPLATIGITLAAGDPQLAEGAALLFLTNLVCITLAAGCVFLFAGFVPQMERILNRRGRRWSFVVTIATVVAVAIPLTVHTRRSVEETRIEREVADIVEGWAPTTDIASISVDDSVDPTLVDVEVAGPEAPGDPDELAVLISEESGRPIEVEVLYTPQLVGSGTSV